MKHLLKNIGWFTLCLLSGCSTISSPSDSSDSYSVNIQPLWTNSSASGTQSYYLRLNPVIAEDRLFVTDYSGYIVAINAQTGATLWAKDTQSHLTTGVTIDQNQLFVATEEGQLIALDAREGSERWRTDIPTQTLASPLVMKGKVFIKGIDNSITAFSQEEGKQLWHISEPSSPLMLHAASRLQAAGGKLIAGFSNGKLAVINPENGALYWSKVIAEPKGTNAIEQMVDIDVTPLVVNGIIYVATYQGQLAALELSSGRLLWSHSISSYSGMAADLQKIYLSDENGDLWAFNENTGAVVWHQKELSGYTLTGPSLMQQGLLVVGDQSGHLFWLSTSDGRILATLSLGSPDLVVSPLTQNTRLYTQTQNGEVYAFKIL